MQLFGNSEQLHLLHRNIQSCICDTKLRVKRVQKNFYHVVKKKNYVSKEKKDFLPRSEGKKLRVKKGRKIFYHVVKEKSYVVKKDKKNIPRSEGNELKL